MTVARILLLFLTLGVAVSTAETLVLKPTPGGVPLDAPLWYAADEPPVVGVAAAVVAEDVERVMGQRPAITLAGRGQVPTGPRCIIVGTLGTSHLIDELVRRKLLDAQGVAGQWEATVLQVVPKPFPGVEEALVVAGSDRRGTAYGLFELSRRLGVSPWTWWADVPPLHQGRRWATGREVLLSPAVRWRGIFLNDEGWGLRPWATAREPVVRSLGPATYARIFELMLRLKANLLWPAMHKGTKAFHTVPGNAAMAETWAIAVGTSHCEPMLRNNVSEWSKETDGAWDWDSNRDRMTAYWRERAQACAAQEAVWTIGLRGIHDSRAVGGGSPADQARRLEDVFAVQRGLLHEATNRDPATIPQAFIPYKEVLDIYDQGLRVPEDVTIVWPDDNHGYLRRLPTPAERTRPGGHGIYYHISYWGEPLSYLWLDSTPPIRIAHELAKAHAFGVDRLWMINVGDIASSERGMAFALEMAWDPAAARFQDQQAWLTAFAAEQFGTTVAPAIGTVLETYYRLVADLRPEHLLREVSQDPLRNPAVAADRRARWDRLVADLRAIPVPPGREDAFLRLVAYPVECAALATTKWLLAEEARRLRSTDSTTADRLAAQATAAHARIEDLTRAYNAAAGGKWARMMSNRAAPGYERLGTTNLGPPDVTSPPPATVTLPRVTAVDLETATRRNAGHRQLLPRAGFGLATALVQEPLGADPIDDLARVDAAPAVIVPVVARHGRPTTLFLHALPTQPPSAERILRVAVVVGDGPGRWVAFPDHPEKSKPWREMVLLHRMTATIDLDLPPGTHAVRIVATDPTVVITGIDLAE